MGRHGKLYKEIEAAESRSHWRDVANLCNALGSMLQREGDLEGALSMHYKEKDACVYLQDTLGMFI